MAVNKKLLRKVKALIVAEPRRLSMGAWGIQFQKDTVKESRYLPPCGTVACLAGWAVLASTPKKNWSRRFVSKGHPGAGNLKAGTARKAQKLLGLSDAEAEVFYRNRWTTARVIKWIDKQLAS